MIEEKILTAALNSSADTKVIEELIDKETLSPEGKVIIEEAIAFYGTDADAKRVDRDLIIAGLERKIPNTKHVAMLATKIKSLPTEVSSPNVVKELREHNLYVLGNKIAQQLAGGNNASGVVDLMDRYRHILEGSQSDADVGEEEYSGVSLTSLVAEKFDKKHLIEIWPPALNDMLDGGAKRGHHILVFAPTEMGKTLKVINMTAGFLKQNLKVNYFCNEEPASELLMRAATRITGLNKYKILESPAGADKILGERNWRNLTLVSMAPGTFGRINAIVRANHPDVVVLDQLRNIDVRGAGNRTESLERAATEARNLARKHNVLVVSVCQAADSASGKKVLNRGDVDSSNVGIPGQCDLMIGIGADEEMERNNFRVLSFPKNKLSGKHEPIPIEIDPMLSKVLS
jgi:archaellum biogenesis ATPase FlaH